MPLEPTNAAPDAAPQNDLAAILIQGLEAPPAAPAAPVEQKEATPPPAEPQTEQKSGMSELLGEKTEEAPKSKLPIDDDEPEPTEPKLNLDEKAGVRFKELKEQLKSTKAEIAARDTEIAKREALIAELKVKAERATELEEKAKTYEQEMSVIKLEKTEAWDKEIRQPTKSISDSVAEIADRYSLDYGKLAEAVETRDKGAARKAIQDLASGLDISPADLFEIYELNSKMQPILTRMESLYANADKALLELQASAEKQTAEQISAKADERRSAVNLVADKVAAKLPFLSDDVKAIAAQVAEVDFDALDSQNKAYNAVAGNLLPKILRQIAKVQADYDAALDELGQYKRAKPNPGGFAPAGPANKPKTLEEAMLAGMGFTG